MVYQVTRCLITTNCCDSRLCLAFSDAYLDTESLGQEIYIQPPGSVEEKGYDWRCLLDSDPELPDLTLHLQGRVRLHDFTTRRPVRHQ